MGSPLTQPLEGRVDTLFFKAYEKLHEAFGPQGWWPLPSHAGQDGFDDRGYHPGLGDVRLQAFDRFQICVGALLTQNTAWLNAERALCNLLAYGTKSASELKKLDADVLERLIRPSGYYRQKALRLKVLANYLDSAGYLENAVAPPRDSLLELKGIGPETADSILLYAFGQCRFVIDAYTLRIYIRLGLLDQGSGYQSAQEAFMASLPPDPALFCEYHALIVVLAKTVCHKTRPSCDSCPLAQMCATPR